MLKQKKRISAVTTVVVLGLGAGAVAAGNGMATSSNGPLRCAIEATATGAAIALESRVETEVALSGSYRFRVASAARSGATNVQQGGGFSAVPGGPLVLGRILLGDASAIYDATLEIDADGTTITCTRRVSGKI